MVEAFRASGDMEMDCENITDLEENRWRNCKLQENKKREMVMFVLRGNKTLVNKKQESMKMHDRAK
jgi:hypothetical protein